MGHKTEELLAENTLLRQELKVAREAADITAKLVVKQFEKTEQMLHRFQSANAQRQAVLDAATQLSIIVTDLDGNITLFNRGAANLLGFSESEMVGKRNISCIHLENELRKYTYLITGFTSVVPLVPDAIKVFELHVKQQITKTGEWTYIRKDGTHLPVNLSITPFYNALGLMRGYVFTAMDMSAHKQMEKELIEAMEEAKSANESKGDFLARMSHEIRTPMNGILGMAHLMKKTSLDNKQDNYLDKIISSANTLLNLINDILDFSKIDAGKLKLESIDFNLNDTLGNLAGIIGLQAEEKGLEFLFHIDHDVPLELIGDPFRLGQILMNLASNAVKFTDKGEIVISVTLDDEEACKEKLQDQNQNISENQDMPLYFDGKKDFGKDIFAQNQNVTLKFSVRDTGMGLLPAQIDYLFEAFCQADDTVTRKFGGTGLGLSICRQLTEMMGGKIWVESAPGQGSNFIFTVNMKCSHNAKASSLACESIFQGRRALVVDDNKTARELLVAMLRSFHMEVDDAVDGKTALQHLEKAIKRGIFYDVVLLDWIMPGMDGIETARRIRENAAMTNTPAMLMVTANAREEAREKAEKVGLSAFLLKPVYPSVMYNTLLQTFGIECTGEAPTKPESDTKILDALKGIQGAKILLVEDNAINQEIAAEFLEDAGMDVTIANNGKESLDTIEKNEFDLVLMDIQMPVMDGLEATRIIRNEKKLTHIPIIAMTAHAMAGDRQKSIEAGMNEHLNKPVDPGALYRLLQRFIPEKKAVKKSVCNKGIIIPPELKNPSESTDPTKIMECLPNLKGINLKEALKHLNNKPHMLITILNDFKKDYADLPAVITELFKEGDFEKIRIHAHNIKGISAYIGAKALVNRAAELETYMTLLANQTLENPPAKCSPGKDKNIDAKPIHLFIDEMEKIINTLKQMPCYSEKTMLEKNGGLEVKSSGKNNDKKQLNDKEIEFLQNFMTLLGKGELTAMDLLPDLRMVMEKYGLEKQLQKITEQMDDIEYEQAAKIIQSILTP